MPPTSPVYSHLLLFSSSTASIMSKHELESAPTSATPTKRVWYRSTYFAAIVLGLCNFAAPGIW